LAQDLYSMPDRNIDLLAGHRHRTPAPTSRRRLSWWDRSHFIFSRSLRSHAPAVDYNLRV